MKDFKNTLLPILIISCMGVTGLGFTTIQPYLIGAIEDQLGFDRAMLGWVSSVNVIGIAVGGLVITFLIGRFSLIHMIQIGLTGLFLFDIWSIYITTPSSMLIIRSLSGFFGGLVYAGAMAAFSSMKDNIRAFGVYVMVYSFWTIIALAVLPYLMEGYGLIAGFSTLIFLSVLSIVGSLILKLNPVEAKGFISLKTLLSEKLVILCLFSYFMMQLAGGVVWAYLERVAKEASISTDFIAFSFSMSGFTALLSGLLVLQLGTKWGIKRPLIWGTIVMVLSAMLLFASDFKWFYFLGVGVFCGAWAFLIPFYQKIQAQFDASGKVVSLGTIVNMGGRAVGPALAALLLSDVAYINIVWIGVIALLFAGLLLVPVFKALK